MRPNNIVLYLIILFISSRLVAQCDPIAGNIDIYDLENQPNNVLTLTGTTDDEANSFAMPSGTYGGLTFPALDIIYEMVIEEGDTFNLFFDLCPATNYDASIGIIDKADITNCLDAADSNLVSVEDFLYSEWSDATFLCPKADISDVIDSAGYVPIARDVWLDPGTYYIVIDGFSEESVGDFTLVIGEMLHFDDYNLEATNQWVDISFTDLVFGVRVDSLWSLGFPMDIDPVSVDNYFIATNLDNGQTISLGTLTKADGSALETGIYPSYPGYSEIRFPLIDPPTDGSVIGIAPVSHLFNDNVDAVHAVNLMGIPMSSDTIEIELNVLSAPDIEELSNLSTDNSSINVTFNEGVYSTNSGTGGVASVHFNVETIGGNLAPSISIITQVGGSFTPAGGEDTLVFNLSMSNSTGSEYIRISAQENSVFSSSGIAMETEWSDSLQLNDRLPPYVIDYSFSNETNSGVDPASEIIIEFDNPVRFQDGSGFTPETIATLCSLKYVNELGIPIGEPISFEATGDIDGAAEINSIIINPTDSLTEQSQVLVIIAGNVIVDANSNIMSEEKDTTFTIADVTAPKISSYSLAPINKYVLLTFSEDIWSETGQSGNIDAADFVITLNSDDENSNATNATIEQVANTLGTVDIYDIDAVKLYLEFDSTPSGAESITISTNSNAIFDHMNNPVSDTSIVIALSDELSPSINISSNNSSDDTGFIHPNASFVVTSTDSLQRSFTDSTCLVTSGSNTVTHDANANIVAGLSVSGTGIPPGVTIASITNSTTFVLSGNATSGDGSEISLTFGSPITNENIEDYITLKYESDGVLIDYIADVNETKTEIEIIPQDTLSEWQEVYLKIDSQNDGVSLTDSVGNLIETTDEIIRVDDETAPTIVSAEIDPTNRFITLATSEPVYNGINEAGGVGGLSESHFELSIVPNELNNVQNVDIENVTGPGGEMIIEIEIILSRADASGSEIITVSPSSSNPIYDRGGNEVSVFLNQKTVTLYDMLSPTVSFSPTADTLIVPNTDFILTFSETIKEYISDNEDPDNLNTEDVSSMITLEYISGGVIDYETSFNADTSIFTLNPSQILTESASVKLLFDEVFSDRFNNSVSPGFAQYAVDDVNPPSFDSDILGSGNRYVRINMSEGVYTDSGGVGALTAADFNLVIDYGNQNGAESISIDYLSDISGGELSGGEDAILVNLSIIGSPNGTEQVMVHAVSGEIFDGAGNSMSANESTTEYTLSAPPVFSLNSSINSENSYVTLIFENGPVFTNEGNSLSIITQDFMVQLTNSDGVISEIMPLYLLIVDENGIPILPNPVGANIVRLGIYLDFIPDGSESIIISPESSNAIYNDEGVNMDGSEFIGPFTLYDQLNPFYNVNIADGDVNIGYSDTIIVSFNEPVRLSGGQPLTDDSAKENFIIEDILRSDTTLITTPDTTITIPPDSAIRIETYFTIVNAPSPDSIWVIMTRPFGSEHVISVTIKNDFEDFSGNEVIKDSTIMFTVRDNVSPGFISGSAVIDLAEINAVKNNPSDGSRRVCFVDALINDDVFTDSVATLPVQASDFLVGIIQNEGSVSSGYVENLVLPDMLQGGQQAVRFKIQFDEVPSGSESLFIHAADNNSIFDNGFNPMSPDSTSDTLAVYDLRFPTIDTTSIEHDGYVDLYSDSTILVYFSEPIRPESFEYSFLSKMDTVNFIHDTSLTSDSLTIFLNTPVMSYDTLDLSIIQLEDTSGNERNSLIERRFFTKAAADFSMPPDDRIDIEDLTIFIAGWNAGDYTKNLGPFVGTPPNIRVSQDSIFGIDDGMAFTQMWLWSLKTFGVSEIMQQQLVNIPSSISITDNTISILPPENVISGQIIINYDVQYHKIIPGDNSMINKNGILLSNNDDQNGLAFIEYALTENKQNPIYFNINKNDQEESEIKVSYSFFDEDFRLISKGDSILHSIVLPTEFTLMQNYPNPFNPSTNIRFTIPSNSFVRLIVYDITGKVVNEIVNGYLETGIHNVEWSGTDTDGIDVSSGVYFYRIEASNYSKTYKMVFVK